MVGSRGAQQTQGYPLPSLNARQPPKAAQLPSTSHRGHGPGGRVGAGGLLLGVTAGAEPERAFLHRAEASALQSNHSVSLALRREMELWPVLP